MRTHRKAVFAKSTVCKSVLILNQLVLQPCLCPHKHRKRLVVQKPWPKVFDFICSDAE